MTTSDKYPVSDMLNDMDSILARLREIASLVTRAAEAETLEGVLERIAHVSRELVNARYAALGVPDGRAGLEYFKVSGISPEQIRHIDHPPRGLGLLGAIMNERQTIRIDRITDDERSSGFPPGHPAMTSMLGVPILLGEELHGMLYLTDRLDGLPFSEQDQWLTEILASYAAMAIASSRLRDQSRRLATMDERDRISMELHDGIIQSLYAIGMQVDLLCSTAQGKQASELSQVIRGLNTVIEDIRHYIQNLRADSYGQRTISDCLREVLLRIHIPDKLKIKLDAPELRAPFSPTTFEAICQIVHEAVSNVIRHADATLLNIRAEYGDEVFEILIADNGRGFDLDDMRHHNGLGLRNIQQRARLHGGHVDILSSPGEGTELRIRVPLKPV